MMREPGLLSALCLIGVLVLQTASADTGLLEFAKFRAACLEVAPSIQAAGADKNTYERVNASARDHLVEGFRRSGIEILVSEQSKHCMAGEVGRNPLVISIRSETTTADGGGLISAVIMTTVFLGKTHSAFEYPIGAYVCTRQELGSVDCATEAVKRYIDEVIVVQTIKEQK